MRELNKNGAMGFHGGSCYQNSIYDTPAATYSNIKMKNICGHLELLKKENCPRKHMGNVVFNQISVLIKLFDIRKFDNDRGELSRNDK